MNLLNCHHNAKVGKHIVQALNSLNPEQNDTSIVINGFSIKPMLNLPAGTVFIDCRNTTEAACGWHAHMSRNISYSMPKQISTNKVDEGKGAETVYNTNHNIIFRHVIVSDSLRTSGTNNAQSVYQHYYKKSKKRNALSPDATKRKELTYPILKCLLIDRESFQYKIFNSIYRNLKFNFSPVEFIVSKGILPPNKAIDEDEESKHFVSTCTHNPEIEGGSISDENFPLSTPSIEAPDKENKEDETVDEDGNEKPETLKLPSITDFTATGMPVDISRLTDRLQHWDDELKRDKKTKSDLRHKQMPKRFNEWDYSEINEKTRHLRKSSSSSIQSTMKKQPTDMFLPSSKLFADNKPEKIDNSKLLSQKSLNDLKSYSTSDLQRMSVPHKSNDAKYYLTQDHIWNSSMFKNISAEASVLITDSVMNTSGVASILNGFHSNPLGKHKLRERSNVPSIPGIYKQKSLNSADKNNFDSEKNDAKSFELRLQGSKV